MFACHWLGAALDTLADIYITLNPADRDRLAAGAEALNRRLAADPHAVGESRGGNLRVAFTHLLVVRFRVDSSARIVRVTGVARYGR